MFDPVSPLSAILSICFAMLTARILLWKLGAPSKEGRFVAIDGLRGYLALFVFLHHSCIWYFFLRTGIWDVPPSNLYTHFGQSSVALFFMITSFLFFTKLIDGKTKGIDWARLFMSRIRRLVPLYGFAMLLLLFIVAIISNYSQHDFAVNIADSVAKWLTFTLFGAPDINGVQNTWMIIAGVSWSLPYEWLFYLSLPVLALTMGRVPAKPYLMLGLLGIVGFVVHYSASQHLLSFAGGIIAAMLVRFAWFRQFAPGRIATLVLIAAVCIAVGFFPTAYSAIPLLLLSVAFSLVAGGNTIFNILSSAVSRTLGEMAYSIYLLHGMVLFVIFNFLIGPNTAKILDSSTHWSIIILATPVLILISVLTFCFIERPFMNNPIPMQSPPALVELGKLDSYSGAV